jgi:hypothetical protein
LLKRRGLRRTKQRRLRLHQFKAARSVRTEQPDPGHLDPNRLAYELTSRLGVFPDPLLDRLQFLLLPLPAPLGPLLAALGLAPVVCALDVGVPRLGEESIVGRTGLLARYRLRRWRSGL